MKRFIQRTTRTKNIGSFLVRAKAKRKYKFQFESTFYIDILSSMQNQVFWCLCRCCRKGKVIARTNDHKYAFKKWGNYNRRMLRVAGMITLNDNVRNRIQNCQSLGNKRSEAKLRRCNTDVKTNITHMTKGLVKEQLMTTKQG